MRSSTDHHFIRFTVGSRIAMFSALVLGASAVSGQSPQGLDRAAVLTHLNSVIGWYRDATNRVQTPGLPSDVVYQDTAQNLATTGLRFAFESARAEAALIDTASKGGSTDAAQPNAGGPQTNYNRMEAQVSAQLANLQSQIEALNKQIADSPASKREGVISQRDALQGQLELNKAMLDSIEKMANFVESSESANQGLVGAVNTLARSVPEALASGKTPASIRPATAPPKNPNSAGLIGQSLSLYDELTAMHGLDQLMAQTARVRDAADAVRKPLRDNLVATIRQGNALEGSSASASSKERPANVQSEYQNLTNSFKQYSGALVPLAQEMAVLDESRSNFAEWRRSIARESRETLQSLLTRVVGITVALGLVLFLSEIWRRLTFKYVRDQRRRRQFLVLRRIVISFLFGIVIILGFVSEFSSLATFAGFVTAGVAVGLQTVLLSVAAYFFVIGRYGIRVGDRISIAGVTGDVIDIGLVRLYLMELSGPAVDLYPTGRIVVFSNSVLFQATTPLFKQIPGTDYTWHEVVFDLAAGGNHKAVQDKVAASVNSIYEQYREGIERQTSSTEGRVEFQLKAPSPDAKLQFGDAGLELIVRYPVGIRNTSEIDDHITRSLIEMIDKDPDLKSAITGSPKIRAVVKG